MNFSPQERQRMEALAAKMLVEELMKTMSIDQLVTIELSTAAQFLGLSAKQAARILPVIEVGPRTRRVAISDYKQFLESRKRRASD